MTSPAPTHITFDLPIPLTKLEGLKKVADVVGMTVDEMITAILNDEIDRAISDREWLQVNMDCAIFKLPSREAAEATLPRYLDFVQPDHADIMRDGYSVVRWKSGGYGIFFNQETVDRVHNLDPMRGGL